MATCAYLSTEETTNASRVCRLLLGPCTDEFRDVLRNKVPPSTLTHTLQQSIRTGNSPRLLPNQRDLVLPNCGQYTGNYDDMDISLLYTILRNICSLPPPSRGWGKNPDPSDRFVSANIERIHLARNQCGHSSSSLLSNSEFSSIWKTLRLAIKNLDNAFITDYAKDVDFLLYETMDPIWDLHYQEELRKQFENDRKTREMLVELERTVEDNTMRISKTEDKVQEISVQHKDKLKEWKVECSMYQETHSFPSMMEKVKTKHFVTFVGVSGSGKSATAHYIALKLAEEGYQVVPIKHIKQIEEYSDSKNPQVFVIDDVVGLLGLEKAKLYFLTECQQFIENPCMDKSITLMTCRENVFNEALMNPYESFFTKEENVIKLHDTENALDENDKKLLFKKYG
ncbi:uncharacterized protein LOC134280148 [Saccostrea cucullata]|uniref:uncharacterized protein LOC134280148 n=1 Tax=Saccostrea cuccullata TaxID=36930 RepID=UPI002ED46EA7